MLRFVRRRASSGVTAPIQPQMSRLNNADAPLRPSDPASQLAIPRRPEGKGRRGETSGREQDRDQDPPAGSRTRTASAATAPRPSAREEGREDAVGVHHQRLDKSLAFKKDVTRYIVDHLDEAAYQTAEDWPAARTPRPPPSSTSQALGFEGCPELSRPRSRSTGRTRRAVARQRLTAQLRPLRFEASLAADHGNLEDSPNLTTSGRTCVSALAASRVMIIGMDQLAFFASYLATCWRGSTSVPRSSPARAGLDHPAQPARAGRAGHRLLGRTCAPDRRSAMKLEAPPGDHPGDHGRDPLRGRRALRPDPLLLVEQPVVHPVEHVAARPGPGARVRGLLPRQGRLQGPHPRLQAEVTIPDCAPGRGAARLVSFALMAERATFRVKRGLAEMLKGGVIMDVVTPDEARIAEEAGAVAVMALERVPADIRRDGGVARMSDPSMIEEIQARGDHPRDGQGAHRPLRRGPGPAIARGRLRRRIRGADARRRGEPHRQARVRRCRSSAARPTWARRSAASPRAPR